MDEGELSSQLQVRVGGLRLLAEVGINPEEVGRRQPLIVSVDLLLSGGDVEVMAQTVDYRWIVETAEVLAGTHILLIETFASRLAQACIGWAGVAQARVQVDKPEALERGMAGVVATVTRAARREP